MTKFKEYTNKERGRIVDGIQDLGSSTGYLYENRYNEIRQSLATFKTAEPTLYENALNHMRSIETLSGEALEDVKKAAGEHGISIESALHINIVKDWAKSKFDPNHSPKFMIDVGTPVREAFYNAVGQGIESFRNKFPEYAKPLDELIKTGPEALINAGEFKWQGEKLGRRFANAVQNLGVTNSINHSAAKAYVQNNPASAPQPAGV